VEKKYRRERAAVGWDFRIPSHGRRKNTGHSAPLRYHFPHRRGIYIPEAGRAVQACYRLSDDFTRKREIDALLRLSAALPVQTLEIVTTDEENEIQAQRRTVKITPLRKWTLPDAH
jgi:hypothetical protein